jgi:hypothetical protein
MSRHESKVLARTSPVPISYGYNSRLQCSYSKKIPVNGVFSAPRILRKRLVHTLNLSQHIPNIPRPSCQTTRSGGKNGPHDSRCHSSNSYSCYWQVTQKGKGLLHAHVVRRTVTGRDQRTCAVFPTLWSARV